LGIYVYFLQQIACANVIRAFCKIKTSFKGLINTNAIDKTSGDVLVYLR